MTQEAFNDEIRSVRPLLVSMARRLLSDADEADDTVQDVLMRLWQMLDQLHPPVAPLAKVLTRNFCINKIRRRRPTISLTGNDFAEDTGNADERYERIIGIIGQLPDLQQTILRLRHMEGMEMREIAQLIGSNEAAIRKALSRARQTLRLQYIKQYERHQ